jgi:two-component system, cell cycle sensor histidine kinase and response regulator CckA
VSCTWESRNPITEKWYINYDRAIRWHDGRIVKLQIATDITERKQAEDERESLRKTAEALAEVFLGLGTEPQQNMDRIVRAACELTGSAAALYNRLDDTGCSLEVWSGHQLPPDMPHADIPQGHICHEATIHGRDRTIILGNLENTVYERSDPAVARYGLKAYLGHPVQLRGAAIGALAVVDNKPRMFTAGEIGAIQMLAKALSLEEERYLAEQELKQSEERFRGMLQNVATVAVQGYALDGTVRYWNRASESFYGYTAEEALGRNLLDLIIPPAMRDEVDAAIRHMAKTGDIIPSEELALIRKDGSLIPVYSSHALVRVPGREPELFCVDVDLSARQEAEEEKERLRGQLSQAQKMESVGRLAGGVAHDFNNMLGVIIGHAELALEDMRPDEPLHAGLTEIRKAAQRSAELTRQLLAFARKQTVAPTVLDLNETVERALNMLRRLIGEDIDLVWRPGRNLEPIFIDSSQVDQILTNLCVNARDAIVGIGKITIETDNVVLDSEYCALHAGFVPGNYVLLTVSDDGCGMDAEMLTHLFEPFYTTKEVGKGTGLGLAMIYGAVKQNNGFISVISEPGHGTTFKIYLPPHTAKELPRPELQRVPSPLAGGKIILLVEDELAILKMTTRMLDKMGYVVLAAGTPGEAIRLARENEGQIDLLMTDVVMPEMNGRDLARNLMSLYPEIKRLFMSGYTANVIAHHGVLDEGVHFIQKPFSMKELEAKLREALEG